jgi:hypothetical protein
MNWSKGAALNSENLNLVGPDQRDLAVNDHGFGVSNPHATVDPDRRAGPDVR